MNPLAATRLLIGRGRITLFGAAAGSFVVERRVRCDWPEVAAAVKSGLIEEMGRA